MRGDWLVECLTGLPSGYNEARAPATITGVCLVPEPSDAIPSDDNDAKSEVVACFPTHPEGVA